MQENSLSNIDFYKSNALRVFQEKIAPFLADSVNQRIGKHFADKVEKVAMAHLKVTNISELRKRFEGVGYLEKIKHKAFSAIALANFLGQEIVDWDEWTNNRSYEPLFKIEDQLFKIKSFRHGRIPEFLADETDDAFIICCVKGERDILIVGAVKSNVLRSNLVCEEYSPFINNKKYQFLNFEAITKIQNFK